LSWPEVLADAVQAVAPLPRAPEDGPVFREPWEAQAFAMTLHLHERGLFTWSEWAQVLGEAIRAAETSSDDRDGSGYYRHWLAALERLVSEKGIASPEALENRRAAWNRAAHATPHGAPIRLKNDPQSKV
jgi:nitrile hydratase accessory protein